MWKSRADKNPPPTYFAEVVAYLNRAFPLATLDRATMAKLEPYLTAEWRNGQSAAGAAKATCSCDGTTITMSPATVDPAGSSRKPLPKRAVLPPKGAKRATVRAYGIEELREPAGLTQARLRAEIARHQVDFYAEQIASHEAQLAELGEQSRAQGKKRTLEATLRELREGQVEALREHEQAQTELDQLLAVAPWKSSTPARAKTPKRRKPKVARKAPVAKADHECTDCKKRGRKPRKPEAVTSPAKVQTPPPSAPPGDDEMEALIRQFGEAAKRDKGQ
jgi:hypothetical protein